MPTFARQLRRYALAGDENLLESLRESVTVDHIHELVELFEECQDWTVRDAIVLVLQDLQDPRCESLMMCALESPNKETRLVAISKLRGDRLLFLDYLRDGYISAEKIDAAIAEYFSKAGSRVSSVND